MKRFEQLVCPVSDKRVDENTVRVTALLVILGMGGFLLTALATVAVMFQFTYAAYALGAILVVFAFLECVLNFRADCWLYTWVVYPLVRKC